MELKGKKAVVVGLARTGRDTAEFLLNQSCRVYLTEEKDTPEIREKAAPLGKKGVQLELGAHSEGFLKGADLVVPSPGVGPENLAIRWAKGNSIPVWSEVELAYRYSPSKKIVAITGTNGKTTTTALTGFLFRNARQPCVVCGNIGNTFLGELARIRPDTWVILEISSFQLEHIDTFRPSIGVLLNITPDHFDRYPSIAEYSQAKERLFSNQTDADWAVLNFDDPYCRQISEFLVSNRFFFSQREELEKGVFVRDRTLMASIISEEPVFSLDQSRLFGAGNVQNMMAVAAVALICGFRKEVLAKTLREFRPLPHRLERLEEIDGITFINDSKSTNVDSVRQALQSFPEKHRIILIMGGKDKGFSFSELTGLIKEKVKLLLLLGETRNKINRELSGAQVRTEMVDSLEAAVRVGLRAGSPGDVVLLSPGCSSFDMFKNYQERGDVFKSAVQALL